MKLIWLTDIHLNFINEDARFRFYETITKTDGDAILISGDIGEAPSVATVLKEMISEIKKPIYFVLGNHDYYRGEINTVKEKMTALTQDESGLYWLPASGPQVLQRGVVLLGQDGWADGRYGDFMKSNVSLNDSRMIMDLFQAKILGKYQLLEKMQKLADKDAIQLQNNGVDAIKKYKPKKIIILTHVPPFKEACLHEGERSTPDFLPFFSSKASGDVLVQVVNDNLDIEFLVLCGHTHAKSYYQPFRNLVVRVGQAEYMQPEIQDVIAI